MISEQNFTRASAATLQAEAEKTREFIRKAASGQVVNLEDLIGILSKNQAMLEFAASELHRILPHQNAGNNVLKLQQKCAKIRLVGVVH